MRDVLLALSVGLMFFYGFYIMKKVDDFLEEVRRYNAQHERDQESNDDAIDEHTDDML